jgi:putative ABC transport system substrate-binding protein
MQGDNLQVDERWSAATPVQATDVIIGQSTTVIEALLSKTRTIPIVFLHVTDPVASGLVPNLAQPERNVTGITNIDPSIGGKWIQLLKEIAPAVTRSALLVNPTTEPYRGELFLDPFQITARSLGVTTITGEVHNLSDIESVMTGLAGEPKVA